MSLNGRIPRTSSRVPRARGATPLSPPRSPPPPTGAAASYLEFTIVTTRGSTVVSVPDNATVQQLLEAASMKPAAGGVALVAAKTLEGVAVANDESVARVYRKDHILMAQTAAERGPAPTSATDGAGGGLGSSGLDSVRDGLRAGRVRRTRAGRAAAREISPASEAGAQAGTDAEAAGRSNTIASRPTVNGATSSLGRLRRPVSRRRTVDEHEGTDPTSPGESVVSEGNDSQGGVE
ncbi:hypothetical protein HK104_007042, partial [Borealophlyctis nickersoniae]